MELLKLLRSIQSLVLTMVSDQQMKNEIEQLYNQVLYVTLQGKVLVYLLHSSYLICFSLGTGTEIHRTRVLSHVSSAGAQTTVSCAQRALCRCDEGPDA